METGAANLTAAESRQFTEDGYVVKRGLLTGAEVEELEGTFMSLHAAGRIPGYFEPAPPEEAKGDILRMFPRMMHPHRYNQVALHYMLHPVIMDILAELLQDEPLGAQTMFYFKPPGARGQALHQDNYYLKVEPGTCLAAWAPIDPVTQENGGLVVVPKSNTLDILCPHEANPKESFTRDEVDIPDGMHVVPVTMEPGDVLFFNGSLIHGSYPNYSHDRFRRVFIGHYVGESTARLGKFYNPLYTRRGEVLQREHNTDAGPCGGEEFTSPH